MSLKWPSRPVEGTCGPLHRSMNASELRYVLTSEPLASTSSAPAPTARMISCLNGWSAKISQTFFKVVLMAHERLVLLDDGPHLGLDPFQVVVAEVHAAGELEVVVEAVVDHGADGVLGAGPQPEHRLGQDVRGGVTEHLTPGVGVRGDDRHLGAVRQLGVEVHFATVDDGDDGRLGQP